MKDQRPIPAEEEHRVLQFRPRAAGVKPGWRQEWEARAQQQNLAPKSRASEASPPAAYDLSRHQRPREAPDEFRHRMLANIAALAFTVALTAVGIWLAMSIADLRRTQDCVLMGRRDCVRLTTPSI